MVGTLQVKQLHFLLLRILHCLFQRRDGCQAYFEDEKIFCVSVLSLIFMI